ncbi:MAG: geranylgeranylglycerol-phosphate geranylgeranyltransferase [Bacteroidetes bacterium]|jgi:4-hydroxybenzoate polyprenyltransferase|nr:geranylgeranylglycerol-phosphate geranylgeranyltransferase [Bacteroidota bacterium]
MAVHIFKLIRWPNLIIIGLLQYLLRYSLMEPILETEGLGLLMTDFEFALLSFSCILIAAGGYVINDIEDEKIDRINKPDQLIVGNHITKDSALNLYLLLSFLGILCGFYLSYIKGYSYLGIINLIISGMLYFYSTSYKCIPVLGNIIISLLSAAVVFIVVIPEPFVKEHPGIMLIVGAFMFFSFLLTLVREIIKDIEDSDGDRKAGCATLANKIGQTPGKWIATLITLLVLIVLISAQVLSQQWESFIPFIYIVLFIDLPLLRIIYLLIKAENKSDFSLASFWLKITMFTGTISLAVFNYSFN